MKKNKTLIVTQTPMRLTVGGGGTDVLWYSKLRGGAWISAAINRYVTVVLSQSLDEKLIRLVDLETLTLCDDYKKIPNPIVRECFDLTGVKSGVDISVLSDASPKSGIGGSGTFELSLLNALHTYKNEAVSQLQLAKEASEIELVRLKKPVGPQDQYIGAVGGINYFEIDKKGNVSVEPLNLSNHTIAELESNLFFFSTGIEHDSAQVHGEQKKVIDKKDEHSKALIQSLDDIKALGQEVKKYLLAGQVDEFGASLHEHWLIKKRLGKNISNPQIDQWYEAGRVAGALGGKIMGAGAGGWMVFYVRDNKSRFRERMMTLGLKEEKVQFVADGSKVLLNL